MLFHVTASHVPADCLAYNLERMPALVEWVEGSGSLAEGLGVKVHFFVNAAPEHVSYLLLEADSLPPVTRFVDSIPIRQDFKVTPVVPDKELAQLARDFMAQQGG